jgi:hypothetical protein
MEPKIPLSEPPVKRAKKLKKYQLLLESQIEAGGIKKEPGVLIKAEDIDNRLPEQVNKLLNWADWYANNGEKTATESALEKAIEPPIFEDFDDSTLPALPPPSTPRKTVHEVRVTYHHVHTFSSSPHAVRTKDEAVIAAVNEARHHIPGALAPVQEGEEEEEKAPKPFEIPELKLQYTRRDIVAPPSTLSYKMSNYQRLIGDWESSNYYQIKGVPIPIKFWGEIFKNKGEKEYDKKKEVWRQWRVS